jgi:4-hydroxybenzoate polyprenyltransferase
MNKFLSLVKFSHTVFALPFAMIGYFLAVSLPEFTFNIKTLLLVVVCMITARNAAMAYNRYIDKEIDQLNPRTRLRELPQGLLSPSSVKLFVLANVIVFIIATYFINNLCFLLSPVALLIILGYSYTKRFTSICHFILGLGLGLAPIGAYLAVTARFDWIPVLYGLSVFFWVAGFDIIYALQDEEFDRDSNLSSIPQLLGRKKSLILSSVVHILSAVFLILAAISIDEMYPNLGYIHYIGLVVFLGLLFYQHTLVSIKDISKVNIAFFTTNGIASMILGITVIFDLFF